MYTWLRGRKGLHRACIKLSKEFLEAGKERLAGDTSRAASAGAVKGFRSVSVAMEEL